MSADPVTEDKLARIDRALDDAKSRIDRLTLERARPPLAGPRDEPRDPALAEHKAAFRAYMRTGEAAGLKRLEEKALSAGSGPDGGYRFWSVRPSPYPIPYDGPVGDLLTATGRGPMRPAHLHFKVEAPGHRTLVTRRGSRRSPSRFGDDGQGRCTPHTSTTTRRRRPTSHNG